MWFYFALLLYVQLYNGSTPYLATYHCLGGKVAHSVHLVYSIWSTRVAELVGGRAQAHRSSRMKLCDRPSAKCLLLEIFSYTVCSNIVIVILVFSNRKMCALDIIFLITGAAPYSQQGWSCCYIWWEEEEEEEKSIWWGNEDCDQPGTDKIIRLQILGQVWCGK